MNVHRLTVFKAYQLLKENGIVYVKDKSGYYVRPRAAVLEQTPELTISPRGYMNNLLSRIQRVPVAYQFSQAVLDPNLLPNLYLSECAKKVFDLYPKVLSTYADVQGDVELRQSIVGYLAGIGVYVSTDELLISTGAQQAIDLLAAVMVRPLDAVLIERPTYSAAIDIFRKHRARLIPVDLSADGYDLADVEAKLSKYRPRLFYLNPTFQNPTGYTVPIQQRKQLAELAEKYRCLLVEDDPFRDIYFRQAPPPPIFTYDTEGWVVYIRGFSKYAAPGLRICAVAARKPMIAHLIRAKSLADNGSPLLNQKIFLHSFSSQRMQQHLEKLRTALYMRKRKMEDVLAPTGWEWSSPGGGFNLWVKLPPTISAAKLLEASLKHSISFVPGSICDPSVEPSPWIRLSYSYLNEVQLEEGISRLVELAESLQNM
jgi:DNA-binding transcriptional MocR family regulator